MKALLTAFALLSFVAASTLPMAASAADAQTDHPMTKSDTMSGKSMATKHTKSHKKSVHKKVKHHKHAAKRVKKHKTMSPPKAG